MWTMTFKRQIGNEITDGTLLDDDCWDSDWLYTCNGLAPDEPCEDVDLGEVLDAIGYCIMLSEKRYTFSKTNELYVFNANDIPDSVVEEMDAGTPYEVLLRYTELAKAKYWDFRIVEVDEDYQNEYYKKQSGYPDNFKELY